VKPATIHRDAEAEFDAGIAYYQRQRAGLGLHFRDEVGKMVEMIRRDPGRWPFYRGSGLRKSPLARSPYNVLYRELEDRSWIAAIAHQRRKPGYWARRTPG